MAEKKDFPVFRVGIVTLSDKGYQGEREDKSGPKIKELLPAEQYEVVSMRLLPDERAMIEEELSRLPIWSSAILSSRQAARDFPCGM